MKTVYLLPCTCGRRFEVDVGQAGTQIQCGCGQSLTVPTIRGLRHLEIASQPIAQTARPSAWSPLRGAMFSVGLLVAVVALAFSAFNGYRFWATRRLADPAALMLSVSDAQVNAMSGVEALAEFRKEESMGLGEPYPPPWTEIDAAHVTSRKQAILGIVVAGVGFLATAGSLLGRPKG